MFFLFQYTPDPDNPKDLSDIFDQPVDILTITFIPSDPDQNMTIGGLKVKFCTHPSMFSVHLFINFKYSFIYFPVYLLNRENK